MTYPGCVVIFWRQKVMLVFPCFFVGAVESKIFDRCFLVLVFVRMLWAFDWAHILKVVATNHTYAANLIAMT